jgi:hypothetical protein
MPLREVPSETGLNSPPFQQQSFSAPGTSKMCDTLFPEYCGEQGIKEKKVEDSRTWKVGCGGEVVVALIVRNGHGQE